VTEGSSHPTDALLALVYGELSADTARTVQRHVDGCAECSATVDDYRAVRGAASALPRELPAPAGLESVLHYGERAAARARVKRGLRWVWPLAVSAVAVWVGVVALRPPTENAAVDALARKQPTVLPREETAKEAPPLLAGKVDMPASAPPVARNEAESPALRVAENAAVGSGSAGGPSGAVRAAAPRPAPVAQAPGKSERRVSAAPGAAADAMATAEKQARARDKDAPAAEAKAGTASYAEATLATGQESPATAGAKLAKKSVEASPLAPRGRDDLPTVPGAVAAPAAPVVLAPVDGGVSNADQARRATLYVRLRETRGVQLLPVLVELCGLEARLGHPKDAVGFCQRVVNEYPGTPEAAAAQRQIDLLRGG
jgi:hypothetical protein